MLAAVEFGGKGGGSKAERENGVGERLWIVALVTLGFLLSCLGDILTAP